MKKTDDFCQKLRFIFMRNGQDIITNGRDFIANGQDFMMNGRSFCDARLRFS